MPPLITGFQLKQVCPTLKLGHAEILAALICELAPGYGMDTANELHEFLATVAHESSEFGRKTEAMGYTARRMMQVWPTRFKTLKDAEPYAGQPEKLANYVYANRMGNGNEASGDGYRFRGAGFIQTTGRDLFTKFAKYRKVAVNEVADLLRTSDRWAMDSALWVFCVEKSLLDEARRDDLRGLTKAINGGLTGYESRLRYWERAKKAIPA